MRHSLLFQSKALPEAGVYWGLTAKGQPDGPAPRRTYSFNSQQLQVGVPIQAEPSLLAPNTLGSPYPLDLELGSPHCRCLPPYPNHLLLPSMSEQYDLDGLCVGMEQSLRGGAAAKPAKRADKSH